MAPQCQTKTKLFFSTNIWQHTCSVIRVKIDGGVGGVEPPSSGLDPPSSGLDPPRFICFVMYFVHEFESTPLALR